MFDGTNSDKRGDTGAAAISAGAGSGRLSVYAKGRLFNLKDGYIRAAAAAPSVALGDCKENTARLLECIREAERRGASFLVLPEHCVTGYTLGDLFLQHALLEEAEKSLGELIRRSAQTGVTVVAGLPVRRGASLFSCAAVFSGGSLLGVVPKLSLPTYAEFYEGRHFHSGKGLSGSIRLAGFDAPFGADLLFACEELPDFRFGVEICEDLWVPSPPSSSLAAAGATVIANPSASTFVAGKAAYRAELVRTQSARCIAAYLYASSGEGESSTDLVFDGHLMIAENGRMLGEAFRGGMAVQDIDTQLLAGERRRMSTFAGGEGAYRTVPFHVRRTDYPALLRKIERQPFVPAEDALYRRRCAEVLDIQSAGLGRRLAHTKMKTAVVAVSGGLDSTLALLVTARAIRQFRLPCRLTAITMPGPGTTKRTKGNAEKLCEALGAELLTIPIGPALALHLKDIGHPEDLHDVTYENSQARERTQIAMDVANESGGLVVGTGDMSELALGFSTYNGDHMSMYGVNCGVPKTLVRHLIRYVAGEPGNEAFRDTLFDILDTPVSPELLPAKDGEIAQKTEQILGPYELHDFFLYYFLRYGFPPRKILRLARQAFDGVYEPAFMKKCLATFLRRFFAAQFKRSCVPDGPKVGSVALSPRGDWRMPSDALCAGWLRDLEEE